MIDAQERTLSKVPAVTLGFWLIKILATTLGETGGDTVTMTLDWGYLAGTALFAVILVPWSSHRSCQAVPPGPVLGDHRRLDDLRHDHGRFRRPLPRDRLHGWLGPAARLPRGRARALVRRRGAVSVDTVSTPRVEMFYWVTITFSQTLGTALGDWIADTGGLGYEGGALVFGSRHGGGGGALLPDAGLARRVVLGRLHPDPAARGDGGRLPRQAGRAMAAWT